MIRIQNVVISNFRSFKDKENVIKNLESLNVMVGKNNVGKTNVLRAIYLFFNPETYEPISDRNMVKQITGGASKDPKIDIEFLDDELIKGSERKYRISCNLNNENFYSVSNTTDDVKGKLSNSATIKKYIDRKFKCIYLSTTDENIEKQSNSIINDMILRYFKKQSKKVKETVDEFEKQYGILLQTFKDNIQNIETSLGSQFEVLSDIGVRPRLEIDSEKNITGFLLDNIKLQLDDSYMQDISNKGAGIQRASLILLSLFLLNEIYSSENKIILLDEPEAFLYPLLVKKIKASLEEKVENSSRFQMFLTSHSRDFLKEINNEKYTFKNIKQHSEENTYQRSKNDVDINKYSVIEDINARTKYEVLKNYGLLDEIDDYEKVIICEGPTDKNYLQKILEKEDYIPQIRYGKYSEGFNESSGLELKYDYIGKGASAILPILIFLDNISTISRKVFVILDGDQEGESIFTKIKETEYKHLEIYKKMLPNGKEIEDMVFSKEDYISKVIDVSGDIKAKQKEFRKAIQYVGDNESFVEQTENFIDLNRMQNVRMDRIKHLLSINLNDVIIQDEWIINDLHDFFYQED